MGAEADALKRVATKFRRHKVLMILYCPYTSNSPAIFQNCRGRACPCPV